MLNEGAQHDYTLLESLCLADARPGWRLVGEFAQPPESQDEKWIVDGLIAAR